MHRNHTSLTNHGNTNWKSPLKSCRGVQYSFTTYLPNGYPRLRKWKITNTNGLRKWKMNQHKAKLYLEAMKRATVTEILACRMTVGFAAVIEGLTCLIQTKLFVHRIISPRIIATAQIRFLILKALYLGFQMHTV